MCQLQNPNNMPKNMTAIAKLQFSNYVQIFVMAGEIHSYAMHKYVNMVAIRSIWFDFVKQVFSSLIKYEINLDKLGLS